MTLGIQSFGQNWVSLLVDSLAVDSVEICQGDSLHLQYTGECIVLYDDFTYGINGSEWTYITPGTLPESPCDTANEVLCLWFGEACHVNRILETEDLDLTPGGELNFDLKFGIQNDPPSCEGPDEMLEGVSLQYSVDQGQTWADIIYFCPNGTFLPTNPMVQSPLNYLPTPFTSWANYTFTVPVPAQTPATRFRWLQSFCSYFNNHYDDNWGVDNVKITRSFTQFIQWSGNQGSNGPITVSPTNTTTYYVYILGGNTPPDTLAIDSVVVLVHPVPDPGFQGDLELCLGDSTVITANGPYAYEWFNGSTADSILVNPSLSTTYFITATDALGCKGNDSVFVLVRPLPVVTLSSDSICIGETATLIAGGGEQYEWSTNQSGSIIFVQPEQNMQYSVTVTDQYGCRNNGITSVVVHPLPSLQLTPDTSICYDDVVTLQAGGGIQYYWSNGAQTPVITVQPAGYSSYYITVVDGYGCQNNGSVSVSVAPRMEAHIIGYVDTICRGSAVVLKAVGGEFFSWSTGAITDSVIVQPGYSTVYTVTVSNAFNDILCSASDEYPLNVEECATIFMPNAFCPKGYNPVFKPVGDFSMIRDFTMIIFDRMGKLIFESHDPEYGWDGTYQGLSAPAGVYTYKVRYAKTLTKENYQKVSTLTLIE